MPDWFAVFTKPRAEGTADHNLTGKGAEVLLPLVRKPRSLYPVPLFARYLFVRGLEPSEIHYTIGVSDLVRCGIEPVTVPQAVIDRLCAKLDEQRILIPPLTEAALKVGDRVEVTQGPLRGLISHITGIDNSKEIKIWCSMFGGAHVSVPRAAVARSNDPECGRISKPKFSATFAA